MRTRLIAVAVCAGVVLVGCSADPPPTTTSGVQPTGFDRVAALVVASDGTECELCLWLADTDGRRRSGLMGVTDLGPADGMAFRYPQPHTGSFWMRDTSMPLAIAFFAEDGTFLDAFDMDPCTSEPCRSYLTPERFTVAIEVPQGGLEALGIGPGSILDLSPLPCDD